MKKAFTKSGHKWLYMILCFGLPVFLLGPLVFQKKTAQTEVKGERKHVLEQTPQVWMFFFFFSKVFG